MATSPALMPAEETRSRSAEPSVEDVQAALEALVLERQQLRLLGAAPAELEANRQAILRAQWTLSHLLLARHGTAA